MKEASRDSGQTHEAAAGGGDGRCEDAAGGTRRQGSSGSCTEFTLMKVGVLDIGLLLLSCFSHVRLCATPQMAAHQAPPSLRFSRQEHWSGLPLLSPMHESEK